ncbi:MAG TPA: HAD-IB family phosphatase, partial [Steroidobacteraceae bacterium]|nr:HAD-IB family phosphatase [Steroidobacteraceae bacterium]
RFVSPLLVNGVFPDAMERIAEHRRNGDVLVLMSASPDLYVPAIARALGFSDVTCTKVRWDGDRLNGELTTANCRGMEKARRFELLRAQHPGVPTVAYGNAASDLDHLRLATRGVLLNGSDAARHQAAQMGVACENWR